MNVSLSISYSVCLVTFFSCHSTFVHCIQQRDSHGSIFWVTTFYRAPLCCLVHRFLVLTFVFMFFYTYFITTLFQNICLFLLFSGVLVLRTLVLRTFNLSSVLLLTLCIWIFLWVSNTFSSVWFPSTGLKLYSLCTICIASVFLQTG